MAKSNDKINYVQLEAVQFLADLIAMPPRERAAYATIIFYLYNNKGKCPSDLRRLQTLCSEHRGFEKIWQGIKGKFQVRNNTIKHKRVTKELTEARRRMQAATGKAVKAAQARWSSNAQVKRKQSASKANGNGNGNKRIYSQNSVESQLAELLGLTILSRKPDYKKVLKAQENDWQKWANHIRLMIEQDNRKPEIIEQVIRWCQANDFWQDNILSTAKLRIQFDPLELKMKKSKPKESLKICVVDRKPGFKYQTNPKNEKVYLCEDCHEAFTTQQSHWGIVPISNIEKITEKGKQILSRKAI